MGFSLLLKIIMPLQGHTDGYDTAFSSSPLAGASFTSGGSDRGRPHGVTQKARRGLVALPPSRPRSVALVSKAGRNFCFPSDRSKHSRGC